MRRSGAPLALALSILMGAPWFLLQSVAWVGMFADFSRTDSLRAALIRTFDGRSPCELCKFVREGKKAEQRQAFTRVELKLDFLVWERPSFLRAAAITSAANFPATSQFLHGWLDQPPTPPPRMA